MERLSDLDVEEKSVGALSSTVPPSVVKVATASSHLTQAVTGLSPNGWFGAVTNHGLIPSYSHYSEVFREGKEP